MDQRDNPLKFQIGDTYFSAVDELGILIIVGVIGVPAILVGAAWYALSSISSGLIQTAGFVVLIIPTLWVVMMLLDVVIALLSAVRNIVANILGLALWVVTLGKWGKD